MVGKTQESPEGSVVKRMSPTSQDLVFSWGPQNLNGLKDTQKKHEIQARILSL